MRDGSGTSSLEAVASGEGHLDNAGYLHGKALVRFACGFHGLADRRANLGQVEGDQAAVSLSNCFDGTRALVPFSGGRAGSWGRLQNLGLTWASCLGTGAEVLELPAELVRILELAVDAREANVGYLVQPS